LNSFFFDQLLFKCYQLDPNEMIQHLVTERFLLLLSLLPTYVLARSPLGYDTVLVLVIIELSFAFAVGLSCIIFSVNIIRALQESTSDYQLPTGDLPPSRRATSQNLKSNLVGEDARTYTVASSTVGATTAADYRTFDDDGEYEIELEVDTNGVSRPPPVPADAPLNPVHVEVPQPGGILQVVQSFADYLRLW
jgi:hypothetical protein